jgi:glycosyltransferase involved in cell wall biosynthesis
MDTKRNSRTSRNLHIAVVTETWPPEINGVSLTTQRLVRGMLSRGHRVSLVRPRQGKHDDGGSQSIAAASLADDLSLADTLRVKGIPIPGYPGLRFGLPAHRLLQRKWAADRPDIVQVVTEGPLGASAVGAARALGLPIISEFHTNFHSYSQHYGWGWLTALIAGHLRRLHNRACLTLAPSEAMASALTHSGYRQVRVVSRGIDTKLFHPGRRSEVLRKSEWGVNDGDLVLAYVGRLAPEKNLALVFAAYEAIRKLRPGTRLLLVGDGPMRRHLTTGDPNVIFAGMRRGVDLATHYASADLFLFPSETETFGNVILEALASGLPVVAYRLAAAAEVVRTDWNGALAEPGKATDFIAAAVSLAINPQALRDAAERAAQSIVARQWECVHDQLEDAYQAVLGHAGRPQPNVGEISSRTEAQPCGDR